MRDFDPGAAPVIWRFEKRAADARHADRLMHEAEVLAAAQVPGVVGLVGLEGHPDEPVLVTDRVDGPDLARTPRLSLAEVAAVVAAVATTLAELHALGVVHGAVVPEHVLLAPDGRPVLCGFGHGGRTGEPPAAEAPLPDAAADPARRPGDPLTPASDVLALGAMLRDLVAASEPAGPARVAANALRAVADRTAAVEPELRPSAGAVAAAVSHAVPGARLPRRGEADGASPPGPTHPLRRPDAPVSDTLRAWRQGGGGSRLPGNHHRRAWGLVAVPVAAVTAVAAVVIAGRGRPATRSPVPPAVGPPGAAPATEPAPATTADRPPTTAMVAGAPARSCPLVTALLAADTDGDGCSEPLRWVDGVVEAAGRRWSVGRPGDVPATGDWSCSGRSSLAVLRPDTGQVFVFGGWAGPGRDVAAPLAARVEGAFALRPADLDGDGCLDLLVERAGGPPVTVPVRAGGR